MALRWDGWGPWLVVGALVACDATITGEPIRDGKAASEGSGEGGAGGSLEGPGRGGGSGAEAPTGATIMTAEEAASWCESYVLYRYPFADGNPPQTSHYEQAGVVHGYGCLTCYDGPWGGRVDLVQPTVADCVRNILHAPCSASVEALDRCVDGLIEGNLTGSASCPMPGTCEDFAAADCDNVVVMNASYEGSGGADCAFEVE